jgi:hypothetical protein
VGVTAKPASLARIYDTLSPPLHPPEAAHSATNSWVASSRQWEETAPPSPGSPGWGPWGWDG